MEATTINAPARVPWNKRRFTGQKPPLKLKEIWAIRIRLQLSARTRDLAMFNLAIDSKSRACDLTEWRMRFGQRALRDGCVSVAVLGRSLGSTSEAAFGNAFRRVTGSTPQRYRSTHASASG